MRVAPNRVEIDDASRWGAAQVGHSARAGRRLRRELGTGRVTSGRSGPYVPDFVVTVDVQDRFLARGGRDARSGLADHAAGGHRPHRAHGCRRLDEIRGPRGCTTGVARLARDIAGAIRR